MYENSYNFKSWNLYIITYIIVYNKNTLIKLVENVKHNGRIQFKEFQYKNAFTFDSRITLLGTHYFPNIIIDLKLNGHNTIHNVTIIIT